MGSGQRITEGFLLPFLGFRAIPVTWEIEWVSEKNLRETSRIRASVSESLYIEAML